MKEKKPTKPCNCPDPDIVEGNICIRCWGIRENVEVKKKKRK